MRLLFFIFLLLSICTFACHKVEDTNNTSNKQSTLTDNSGSNSYNQSEVTDSSGHDHDLYQELDSRVSTSSLSRISIVDYYNPNTGTQSTYTLIVDYNENGDVEQINFDHGGYIDESHIVSQMHNDDGTITIETDRGVEYTVESNQE